MEKLHTHKVPINLVFAHMKYVHGISVDAKEIVSSLHEQGLYGNLMNATEWMHELHDSIHSK